MFPVCTLVRFRLLHPNIEIKGEILAPHPPLTREWVYDDIYYSVELSPRGSRQTCRYRIVRVAQKAGNDPKTRTRNACIRITFSRNEVSRRRTRGRRGRGQCSHRHFMKIAPPVPAAPERSAEICYSHLAINSRYFISNTRSVARGMLREDDRFPLPPHLSLVVDFFLFFFFSVRCLRTMKYSRLETIPIKDYTTFCQLGKCI